MSVTTVASKLSASNEIPSTPEAAWSTQIADRYHCRLSPELVDWWDGEHWRFESALEFAEPLTPSDLLVDCPDAIWPGLMPCDLLPLVGNGMGDWLCVKIQSDGQAKQIVHWYHGGGDWLPWGNSLAEAFLFDAVHHRVPGVRRQHAVPAEPFDIGGIDAQDPFLKWAAQHLPATAAPLFDPQTSGHRIVEVMLDHELAEVALRCELVQFALYESLSESFDQTSASQWDLDWPEVVSWMFDTQRIPTEIRQRLERETSIGAIEPQNWQVAGEHARRVTEIAPQVGWAWDILGYAAEREGNIDDAVDAYQRGLECSVFSDQAVRLRTHWVSDRAAKFSAARLMELRPNLLATSPYLRTLCQGEASSRSADVTQYWIDQADEARQQQDWESVCTRLLSAGWDVGAEPMTVFGELCDEISQAAELCGQAARAQLANTHLNCFRDRYGI